MKDLENIEPKLMQVLEQFVALKMHDAEFVAWKLATETSAAYINRHMASVRMFTTKTATPKNDIEGKNYLLDHCIRNVTVDNGLFLEFGVHEGRSINFISSVLPKEKLVHGFDSFEGLPGEWLFGRGKGHFSLGGELPPVKENVRLHKGWFDQTLPEFLKKNPEPFAFVHIDCDLYSSTRDILNLAKDRFVPGTIIAFDEYFNYPGWEQHEYKAFQEFMAASKLKYEYIGCAPRHYSVAVKLFARS
ncbi:MAG: TylF/MycF/NovP-related O-methyltransferase [Limisphaerales bacterium]